MESSTWSEDRIRDGNLCEEGHLLTTGLILANSSNFLVFRMLKLEIPMDLVKPLLTS
jgi:hypothetical protein